MCYCPAVTQTVERSTVQSITEAIAKAMESAERMKHIVIVYELLDDDSNSHGICVPRDQTMAQTNFMLDVGKRWCTDFSGDE